MLKASAFAALGLGWLNWLNYDSVLTLHVAVFAVIVLYFVILHLFLIRREGPVHPIVKGGEGRIDSREGAE